MFYKCMPKFLKNTPAILVLVALLFLSAPATSSAQTTDALVRGTSSPTVYYQANGARYVFADAATYFSWFKNFEAVVTLSDAELAGLELKGTVPYRPGVRLVKTATDPRVYAVDADRTLRWVTSEALARTLYGADWNRNIADIDNVVFARYTIGPAINEAEDFNPHELLQQNPSLHVGLGLADSPVAPRATSTLASATDLLPDLIPFAPYDVRFATLEGRPILKFTATLWNGGRGPLEINTEGTVGADIESEQVALQRIFLEDGGHRDAAVGTLVWHIPHAHYHYGQFANYVLEPANDTVAPIIANKISFCMRDDITVRVPGSPEPAAKSYDGCKGFRQGVSVGWADIYPHTLPDQYFELQGMPSGTYRLRFEIDPTNTFFESRRDNNVASTLVELNMEARTVRVLGRLAPFDTTGNTLADGTLIAVEESNDVYQVFNGHKRKVLRQVTEDTYSWPRVAVDNIPSARFVRSLEDGTIYMINDSWRRRILSPEILSSYAPDNVVVPIAAAELVDYPFTDLVASPTGDVYSLSDHKWVGTLSTLPASTDASSIQTLNAQDIAAYNFPAR